MLASFSSQLLLCVKDVGQFKDGFGNILVMLLCAYSIYVYVSVSLRLAFPSVPFISRVAAPIVVALLMLFSAVMGVGSVCFVGAVGEYLLQQLGR